MTTGIVDTFCRALSFVTNAEHPASSAVAMCMASGARKEVLAARSTTVGWAFHRRRGSRAGTEPVAAALRAKPFCGAF